VAHPNIRWDKGVDATADKAIEKCLIFARLAQSDSSLREIMYVLYIYILYIMYIYFV